MDPSRSLDLDAATVRALELHEMAAQAGLGRVLRDLGEMALLTDPLDADPFVNRAAGLRFPAATRAFDARLDELVVLFATLGRRPHVWSSPLGGTPEDLPRRLLMAGFERTNESRLLAVAPGSSMDAPARHLPAGVRVRRLARLRGEPAASAGSAAATVLAAAFRGADEGRLAADVASSLRDRRRTLYLADVETQHGRRPVAVLRRFSADGFAYLSSIGTQPDWQGRGLAEALVSAAISDSAVEGARLVFLAVESGNHAADRLYARLGFGPIGRPVGRFLAR